MIKDGNLAIRFITRHDLATLVPLLNDLELRGEYLPGAITSPRTFEKNFEIDGLANDSHEKLLIVDQDDAILGIIWHFKSVPYFNAREIGYTVLAHSQRNRGIATRAVRLLSQYLFNTLLINRLEIRMNTANLASEKVAIKCGFTREGVARGANFVLGQHVDMAVYALLREQASLLSLR
jgi:ribosomal-protein-alanine N-acetyltransferase